MPWISNFALSPAVITVTLFDVSPTEILGFNDGTSEIYKEL